MSYNLKTNNTTLFLVPPIGISRLKLKENGFIGAYLGDVGKPEIKYDRGVFMLFRPPNMAMFEEFMEEEKIRTPWLVEDYDYAGGYVVVIYALEEEFADDYQKFLEGRYSKFSASFKNRFTKTVRLRDNMGRGKEESSWQWRIFKKDPEIKKHWEEELNVTFTDDMEVWSKPTLEEEILNIHKIKGPRLIDSGE